MDKENKQKSTLGFTLLETLIAVTVVAAVGTLIVQVFFTTTRSNTKTEILKEVKQNGDSALELISRMVRNSSGIQNICDSTTTYYNYLTITNPDGYATTFGCQFDTSLGISRLASVSAQTVQYLTTNTVTLGGESCSDAKISFGCVSIPDEPGRVTVAFTLSQKGATADTFETSSMEFQTAVSPRN